MWWTFLPSKSLADFVCSNLTVLDFIVTYIVALSLPVKTSATESDFACVNHLDWGFNVATKIIVNIFLTINRLSRDIVSKGSVNSFKKRQRTK